MPRVRTIIASLLRGLRAKQSIYWQAVHSLGRGGSSVAGRPGSGAGSRSSSGSERYRWKVDPPWRKNVKFYGGVPPFPTIPLLLQPLGNRNSITRNLRHPKYITHSISISPLFFLSLSLFWICKYPEGVDELALALLLAFELLSHPTPFNQWYSSY